MPQHVVQQLLDHMSREMTAVSARERLHDKTLRRYWENAVKVNAEGQARRDPRRPPARRRRMDAAVHGPGKGDPAQRVLRPPVQTDCEYANPCLDCRFFITTTDFLDQHRRQRDETARLIDDAQRSGLARIAERNRRTLGKLDAIIDALEATRPGQIVAGGTVENLDAAG